MSMIAYDDSYYPKTTVGNVLWLIAVFSPIIALVAFIVWFCW